MEQQRKIYERPEDLAKERVTLARFTEHLKLGMGYKAFKLHQHERIDFLVLAREESGARPIWIEIKCRDFSYGDFDTHFLAEQKYRMLQGLAQAGQKCFVLFALNDGDYSFRVGGFDAFGIKLGGRSDRGDLLDQEAIVHIPHNLFEQF